MQSLSHTGTKMFSQQWREKHVVKVCGVTKYLNIISVLYRQTHNTVYYTECFVLRKHSLADVGKVISGDLHRKKHLILSQQHIREDETLNAT